MYLISRGVIYYCLFFSQQVQGVMFLLLVLVIVLLKKIEQRSLCSGSIIERKKSRSFQAIFPM
jgi:hypothetical protein